MTTTQRSFTSVDLMTVRDLEKESLGKVSQHTWRSWMRQGRVPTVTLGRLRFVLRQDYEAFIRANRREARPSAPGR